MSETGVHVFSLIVTDALLAMNDKDYRMYLNQELWDLRRSVDRYRATERDLAQLPDASADDAAR